jgi:hypothetical protein
VGETKISDSNFTILTARKELNKGSDRTGEGGQERKRRKFLRSKQEVASTQLTNVWCYRAISSSLAIGVQSVPETEHNFHNLKRQSAQEDCQKSDTK